MKKKIQDIKIKKDRRPLKNIEQLKESINAIGLLNPITINDNDELIAGYHRLEACKSLGHTEIECNIVSLEGLEAELAEIDENLQRNELSELEQGEQLVRRKEIYEELYPESKNGQYGGGKGEKTKTKSENDIVSFSDNTANTIGKSQRTIQRSIQIANKLDDTVKEQIRNTDLADNKTALLKLSRQTHEEQKKIVDKITSGETDNINVAIIKTRKDNKREEIKNIPAKELEGKFNIIYMDPPWKYDNESESIRGTAEAHYPTMGMEELKEIPINNITLKDSVMFMWTTNSMIKKAFTLIEEWGFEFKTSMIWVKHHIGTGFFVRSKHEILLIATKGNFTPLTTDIPASVVEAKREEHSKKPEIFYDIIEKMYPDQKYIEIFARDRYSEKWEIWGNEV